MKMFQQILDLLGASSVREKNLSRSTRFFWLVLLFVILAIPTLLCGFIIGFKAAFQMWLFGLAAIVPFVSGFFLIGKYQWNNPKFAFLLAAGLLGFITFEWSLLGMLIDERGSNANLSYTLSIASLFGIVTFTVIAIISYLFTMLLHAIDSKR
jgi:FtsH-binding integral membrane protein